ncbi:MAG: hypothetical protein EXS06_07515 [Planctomycetaceae bacterium]|nr:hypothetical protein [Planctomycetaceae bacterium]
MNANTLINSCNEMDTEMGKPYEEMGKTYEPMQRKQRRPEPRRKGHGGSAGGGMHCRSNKSHTWGTGAGARLADLRAFAGAVALVVFALLSPASAAEFTWQPVGSIGNAENPITGLGRVTTNYKISAYDTTISQYVEFLNGSDAGKRGLYGVYNTSIGKSGTSSAGILRTGPANNYVYTVVSGFESKPVNFVNWFSAARFVNWYANGKANTPTATESGSYTLVDGQTSGNIVGRSSGAEIFLPSADEWTKAAFYKGGATGEYWLWPTQSNNQPVAVLPSGNDPVEAENAANYKATSETPVFGMTNVGTYVNTKSTYGLFDMLGNVTQMTDTAGTNATTFQAFGGSYAALSDDLNLWNSSNSTGVFRSGNPTATMGLGTPTIGFRVAAIAVPEPGNMVAAAMGIGGLFGLQIMKRRKLALARAAG